MKNLIFILSIFIFSACSVTSNVTNSGKCKTVQCYSKTKAGNRCKNITTNCSGRCHVH